MRDLDELRRALADETAGRRRDRPAGRIRGRARRVRARRTAMGAAFVASVVALAVPVFAAGDGHRHDLADRTCGPPSAGSRVIAWLGEPTETGVTGVTIPDSTGVYDTLVGLTHTADLPTLTVMLRNQETGIPDYLWEFGVRRVDGQMMLPGSEGTVPILDFPLTLGANTLFVGIFPKVGNRITVTTDGYEADASVAVNGPTGWTIFWSLRGPARAATVTAYNGPVVVALDTPVNLVAPEQLTPINRNC